MKKLLLAVALVPTFAFASADLAKKHNCFACHQVDKKLVGPAFNDIAKKHGNKVDYIAGKIRSGGSGVWGPIPMPAQAQVSEADAKKLAEWILSK